MRSGESLVGSVDGSLSQASSEAAGGDNVQVRLDARQFAHAAQALSGRSQVEVFPRFVAECREAGRVVQWSVQGSVDTDGACWLELDVSASVVVQCQRCLGDLPLPIASRTRFRLVFDGEAWDDADLEDDSFEALELDGPLELATLVEDELLLALPPVPMHEEACGLPAGSLDKLAGNGRPSPFAVLGALKKS